MMMTPDDYPEYKVEVNGVLSTSTLKPSIENKHLII
jgi:hypothetical protein